jgi:hypothetical protein
MVTLSSVSIGNEAKLNIFAQNIRGLGNKVDELVLNWVNDPPHILCLSEHHLSSEPDAPFILRRYTVYIQQWVHAVFFS